MQVNLPASPTPYVDPDPATNRQSDYRLKIVP
jgi:hypothetical protein